MIFDPEFFRKISVKNEQIAALFKGANRSLELALNAKEDEIILHFCYGAIIKLGIAIIAKNGYKVRSIPGHHIKILEAIAELGNLKTEIKYINNIRKKRNADLYEGGASLSDKESVELVKITKKIFQSFEKNTDKNKLTRQGGFTLVELIISVGITAVLMVGIATFFSSTFRNMFATREKVVNTQEQFVVNTILDGKFVNAESVDPNNTCEASGASCAVIRNDMDTGALPFTFIGRDNPTSLMGYIRFKDFFVFNGRYGSENSFDDITLNNPAGIVTNGGNERFVTAPLENKIYRCLVGNCSGSLDIPDLNQPMDIDIDLDGTGTLYVADAGNNRVIAITNFNSSTPAVDEIATDLNYPTGVAFYLNINTGKKYLFVADTYSHLIKKITLTPPYKIETVVGEGDDEDCTPTLAQPEHSARFCKLHFPTDVMIGADGKSYYIADTGNGRVLKVKDPDPDLSDYKILTTVETATQISKIDFEFPADATMNPIPVGSPNTLHSKGAYEMNGHTFTFSLSTTSTGDIMEDSFSQQVCVPQPQPPLEDPPLPPVPDICTDFYHHIFKGFTPADDIFLAGDLITINGDPPYTVNDPSVSIFPPYPDNVSTNLTETKYGAGAEVKITKEFPAGDYDFFLNLEDVEFEPGFNLIYSKVYDSVSVLNNDPPNFQTLRVGDGVLGTFEDTIELVDDTYDYPTGLGWDGTSLGVSASPDYDLEFPNYDYVSDFLVQDFGFSEPNGGNILELIFDANLGKDAEGNNLWQDYSLSSDVAP